MKNVPGAHANVGAKIGGALLAGLAVMGELAHGHHSGPSVFMEHHHHERTPDHMSISSLVLTLRRNLQHELSM